MHQLPLYKQIKYKEMNIMMQIAQNNIYLDVIILKLNTKIKNSELHHFTHMNHKLATKNEIM
jgi:hypothetical protein